MGLGSVPMFWDEDWALDPPAEGDAYQAEAGVVCHAQIEIAGHRAVVTIETTEATADVVATTADAQRVLLSAEIDVGAGEATMSDMFGIKRGDTLPKMPATLRKNGAPVDLSTATKVTFFFRVSTSTGAAKSRVCDIIDATNGKVEVPWAGNDTDTAGIHVGEFEILFTGGGRMTIPNDVHEPYTEFEVLLDLGTST